MPDSDREEEIGDDPKSLYDRGQSLRENKRFGEALAIFDRAIALQPDYPQAFNSRGCVLRELRRLDEALASFDQAIALKADYAEAFVNRGVVLKDERRLDEALASYDKAIALNPNQAWAFNNRGNVLTELKRLDEAIASYDQAVALQPDLADAYKNRAHGKLLTGAYLEGWQDYDWRFKATGFLDERPPFAAPLWRGEDLAGRSIVVYGEQGIGDAVQFVRYLPLLVRRRANVTFMTGAKTARLFSTVSNAIQIVDRKGKPGRSAPRQKPRAWLARMFQPRSAPPAKPITPDTPFDFQCALMDLPLRFQTGLSSIPRDIPYLHAEKNSVSLWKRRLGDRGLKVGIVWQGNPAVKIDRGRSIPLEQFFPLASVPGVRLISLQKHHGLEQLANLPPGVVIESLPDDFDSGPDAFIDTAAVMQNLDLTISSDTAAAHLAGALGLPVWLALKQVPDWRWMLDRDDSPWYPTMRLFRQQTDGDWKPVFARIAQALRCL